jgi:hypothetical protein
MDAESWYNMIKCVKTSRIVEIKGRFTLSNFIPWIEDGADFNMLSFKTRDECEKFVNSYYPNISLEDVESALREIQISYDKLRRISG